MKSKSKKFAVLFLMLAVLFASAVAPMPAQNVYAAASGVPGSVNLSHDNWDGDGNYNITMNMWWGNNGTTYELYENNVCVYEIDLTDNSPNPQLAATQFSGKPNGTYTYKGRLINSFGATESTELTIQVTSSSATPTPTPTNSTPTPTNTGTLEDLECVTSDATSVKLHWTPYSNTQAVKEYKVYRDGTYVGSTVSKTGYFNDYHLTPNTTYQYQVEAIGANQEFLAQSSALSVQTGTSSTIRTNYKVLVLAFDPKFGPTVPSEFAGKTVNGINLSDWYASKFANKNMSDLDRSVVIGNNTYPFDRDFDASYEAYRNVDNFFKSAQNLIKLSSQGSANIEPYRGQVIRIDEYPEQANPNFQQSDSVIFEMATDREHCFDKGCTHEGHTPKCETCGKYILDKNILSAHMGPTGLSTIDLVRNWIPADQVCNCTSDKVKLDMLYWITYDVNNHGQVSYEKMMTKPYAELDGYSVVDLIEKGDIDAVWVMSAPPYAGFGENALLGNTDIGDASVKEWNNEWKPDGEVYLSNKAIKCSKSFFCNFLSPDPRAYDGYIHMFEGVMASMCDAHQDNWPKIYNYEIYKNIPGDTTTLETMQASFNLWGRFRATDTQNNGDVIEVEPDPGKNPTQLPKVVYPYNLYAPAAPGNANCGSSHYMPSAVRGQDYSYNHLVSWQNYVLSCADDWFKYPNLPASPNKRMITGYEYGAFDDYQEGCDYKPFAFNSTSYHAWWFHHLPHNPGVADGKLNNWWPYFLDFNRFDGSAINYTVDGFPTVQTDYTPVNLETGTEESTTNNWGYWNSVNKDGKHAVLSTVSKVDDPINVKNGQYALKAEVNNGKFSDSGRNDLFYPATKNANWDLSTLASIKLAVKPDQNPDMLNGANPVIRLYTNGGNRIELVPKKNGVYYDMFSDTTLKDSNGWYNFEIPVAGNSLWEKNVVGYTDENLTVSQLEQNILANVNYVEISFDSTLPNYGDTNEFSLYLDDIQFVMGS